jgi:aspartate/methionine/tyrosine aminotransferase
MDEIKDLMAQAHCGPTALIDLASGTSHFDIRQHAELTLDAGALSDVARYGDCMGMYSLRCRVAEFLEEVHGTRVDPGRIMITDGASGALTIALGALLQPGAEAIIPGVSYPMFSVVAEHFGARCICAPLTAARKVDIDAIEESITPRTRAIVLNSPSNPFGTVLERSELSRLASFGVPLVSDEVYSVLSYDGRVPSALEVEGDHFVINSFSKAFAVPGLRIGYVVIPDRLVTATKAWRRLVNIATSMPSQLLAHRLIEDGPAIIRAHREFLHARRDAFVEIAAGLELALVPRNGMFGVIDVSSCERDSDDIARELVLTHRLSVVPGADFCRLAPDGGTTSRFLRVNFSCHPTTLAEGLGRLERYLAARS